MSSRQDSRWYFASPHATVYLLLAANVAVYGLCLARAGTPDIPGEVLLRYGAMYSDAIGRHEYWRLFACGFLHANPVHLGSNMLCLVLWGGPLERRIGAFYFLVIYGCALLAGSIIGYATAAGPYLSVGASGAISGVLGALLALWILGKLDVAANFFVVNIGLNVVLAASVPGIDWGAHLGGFITGMIACAVLDAAERASALVLRCKFPEFVKVNVPLIAGALAVLLWRDKLPAATAENLPPLLEYVVACGIAVKLIDLILSIKKGLAIVALALAAANAAMVFYAGTLFAPAFAGGCAATRAPALRQIEMLRAMACTNPQATLAVAAASALVVTLLLYARDIHRGLNDVGFIGPSLRAERKRSQGL
jgi:membrane associated rhomboid family serine protease